MNLDNPKSAPILEKTLVSYLNEFHRLHLLTIVQQNAEGLFLPSFPVEMQGSLLHLKEGKFKSVPPKGTSVEDYHLSNFTRFNKLVNKKSVELHF